MTGVDEADTHGLLRPYAEIFSIPRAWRFSVAGVIGRLPMSMYGLGTVLLISAGTGRYGLAGTVAAGRARGRPARSATRSARRSWDGWSTGSGSTGCWCRSA